MKIVTVIPLAKGVFKEDLTYFTAKDIPDGSIVTIPVRNKKTLGIALSSEEVSENKSDIKNMSFNLRKILEVKERSIFSDEFLNSGMELAKYFASQSSRALTSLLPASFREGYDKIANLVVKLPIVLTTKSNTLRAEKLLLQSPFEDRISFYKTLIRSSFAEKKSVFFILPAERDIKNLEDALGHGIENFTFSIHGNQTAKKQIEQFGKITNIRHPILVFCTAQFLCIPRSDIGTIILEHESAGSYKIIARPHLDMRIFVELFAQKIGAKLILADTLLRFETIQRREELAEARPLSFRLNFKGDIEIKNPNEDLDDKKFKIFSYENIEEIKETITKGQNVFIFSLRKGLATETVCHDCGHVLTCENCSSPVVLYLSRDGKKRMFICNRCGKEKKPETRCPHCNSWNLTPLGIGTDTVEEELKKHFPKNKILKIDKESAKSSAGAEKIIKEFSSKAGSSYAGEKKPGNILIGTEMAFFYLKEKVPLSIISSFDSLWSIPNFRMSEKILHIIFSMLSFTDKKLLILTKNGRDSALKAIKNENLLNFIREELSDRSTLGYPPFKRFIKISYLGNKEETKAVRAELAEKFKDYRTEIFSGFVAKLKNKYTTNVLIKLNPEKWSLPELTKYGSIDPTLLTKLTSLPPNFSINVDPEDLL